MVLVERNSLPHLWVIESGNGAHDLRGGAAGLAFSNTVFLNEHNLETNMLIWFGGYDRLLHLHGTVSDSQNERIISTRYRGAPTRSYCHIRRFRVRELVLSLLPN